MMTLNFLDICVIMATVISAVIGLIRGMTKESITLLTWVFASVLGIKYGVVVGAMFDSVSTEMIKKIIGGSLIFIGVLIVGGILNAIISKFVKISGFILIDKLLGAGFGVLRSWLILLILVALINDAFVNETWWKESTLIPKLHAMAESIKANLPQNWIQSYTEFTSNFKS